VCVCERERECVCVCERKREREGGWVRKICQTCPILSELLHHCVWCQWQTPFLTLSLPPSLFLSPSLTHFRQSFLVSFEIIFNIVKNKITFLIFKFNLKVAIPGKSMARWRWHRHPLQLWPIQIFGILEPWQKCLLTVLLFSLSSILKLYCRLRWRHNNAKLAWWQWLNEASYPGFDC